MLHEIDIRATPTALWQAITDPEYTRRYWYGAFNRSDWTRGARWTSESEDGQLLLEGEILEVDPPHRLVHTFHVVHEKDAAADPPSRVTWEIAQRGDACRLRLAHEDLGDATRAYVTGGWEHILAGLKTLLETGV